jgi:hypothetical protein
MTQSPDASAPSVLGQILFYPAAVPGQVGWPATLAAIIGLVRLLTDWRRGGAPYLALLAGVYVTLTPVSELHSRHAIYWVPAIALCAASGVAWLGGRSAVRTFALATALIGGTAWATFRVPQPFVTGYADAAAYVVSATTRPGFCLFDAYLNGNFIYQVRRLDPARRLWVLRGDKLIYSTVVEVTTDYTAYASTHEGIRSLLYRHDPEFIVVEDPPIAARLPAAVMLRDVLRNSPDRYRLERAFPVRSSGRLFDGVRLLVYRSLVRNPAPEPALDLEMLGLRGRLTTDLPWRR